VNRYRPTLVKDGGVRQACTGPCGRAVRNDVGLLERRVIGPGGYQWAVVYVAKFKPLEYEVFELTWDGG
jgi:hypothetical protein